MELIQALEQLSLEVRTKRPDISIQQHQQLTGSTSEAISNFQQPWPSMIDTHFVGHHNSLALDIVGSQRQLQDFDNSIETLFAQISDLDCLKASHPQQLPFDALTRRTYNHCNKNTRQADLLKIQAQAGGSMDTSQEEDSDCSSSQQSSSQHATSNRVDVCVDPLVRDLLKRDLRDITDTVRKIGSILKIGAEIETIYNRNLFSSRSQHDGSQPTNLTYSRSLCDTFMDLCSSEPHIMDLPTIIRYNDYCHRLLNQLNKFTQHPSTGHDSFIGLAGLPDEMIMDSTMAHNYNFTSPLGSGGTGTGDEDDVEYDETNAIDSDTAFLNRDQRRCRNWTDNKLYINHHQSG